MCVYLVACVLKIYDVSFHFVWRYAAAAAANCSHCFFFHTEKAAAQNANCFLFLNEAKTAGIQRKKEKRELFKEEAIS